MRTRLISLSMLLALMALVAVGCGDDDSNPTGSNNNNNSTAIDLSSAQVTIPTAMSNAAGSNAGAAQAVGLLNLANSFTTYSSWWTPPSPSPKSFLPVLASGVDTTITWSQDGLTVMLQTNQNSVDKTWTVTLNGTDGTHTFEDFVFISGYVLLDGSDGSMSVWDLASQQNIAFLWSWGINPSQTFYLNLSTLDDDGYLSVESYSGGNGAISHMVNSNVAFSATWQANGAGAYTIYDSGGNPTNSGTWPGN